MSSKPTRFGVSPRQVRQVLLQKPEWHVHCEKVWLGGGLDMKSNYFRNKIGGAILGLSLLLGIGLMSSTTAQAQYRNQDQYRRDRYYDRDQQRRDDWRYNRNSRGRNWDG